MALYMAHKMHSLTKDLLETKIREMAPHLRALAALAEKLSSFLSIYIRHLTTTYDFSTQLSDVPFWLAWTPVHTGYTYMLSGSHTDIHTK